MNRFAICSSKVWDENLIERLKTRLGFDFMLITSPDDLNSEFLDRSQVKKLFFPHWSYIIKPEIFDKYECVIFHMTDLPYGRGGSPLQNLIVNGAKQTKISALRCIDGIDTGPVYLKRDLSLEGNAQDIYRRATLIIEQMIIEILLNDPQPVSQIGEIVNFKRRKPSDGNIIELHELNSIYDYIRMLDADGYPNAFIENDKIKYEFHSAQWNGKYVEAKVRIKEK